MKSWPCASKNVIGYFFTKHNVVRVCTVTVAIQALVPFHMNKLAIELM